RRFDLAACVILAIPIVVQAVFSLWIFPDAHAYAKAVTLTDNLSLLPFQQPFLWFAAGLVLLGWQLAARARLRRAAPYFIALALHGAALFTFGLFTEGRLLLQPMPFVIFAFEQAAAARPPPT